MGTRVGKLHQTHDVACSLLVKFMMMAGFPKRANNRLSRVYVIQVILFGWLLSGVVLIVLLMRQLSYDVAERQLGVPLPMTEYFRNNAKQYPSSQIINRKNACSRMRTVDDVRLCYPNHVRQNHRQNCENITTLESVQRCLTGKLSDAPIREIHVVGERHSGTKFLTQTLQNCFDSLKVHRDFVRSKHFFQPLLSSVNFTESLVVVIVRDPLDWIAAMHENPYHSPEHIAGFDESFQAIPLPWLEFVQKPWTSTKMTDFDSQIIATNNDKKVQCRERFGFRQVQPCRSEVTSDNPWKIPERNWRGYEPIYEQNMRGWEPYNNLLELRADKITNWVVQLPLLLRLGGFILVRYEDLLKNGTSFLLDMVSKVAEVSPVCPVMPPQERSRRYVPNEFRDWVYKHIDCEREQLIGYECWAK